MVLKEVKWIGFILVFVLVMTACGMKNLVFDFMENDSEAEVKSNEVNKSDLKELVIPNEYKGKSVTRIGDGAFTNCSKLQSITIPASITSIGEDAFKGCLKLSNLYYEGSMEDWCKISFSNECSNPLNYLYKTNHFFLKNENNEWEEATSIVVPNTITEIGNYQFYGFNAITSITIPFVGANVNGTENTYFGYIFGATSHNNSSFIPTSLKEVIITGGSNIGDYAFYYCSNLERITLPNSITSIGEYALSRCENLKDVYYEGTLEDWCKISFAGLYSNPNAHENNLYLKNKKNEWEKVENITEIKIPNTMTTIGNHQFYEFNNVTSVTIPDTITSIEESAFYNCRSLTSLTIPNSVTSIGYNAFHNCNDLESLSLPFIGANIDGTENTHLGYIFGAESEKNNGVVVPKSIKEVTITGGTRIGEGAFSGCHFIENITIPKSITSIGRDAFLNCSYLENIYYEGTLEDWCKISLDAYCSNPMESASHFFIKNNNNEWEEITSIELPRTITEIGDNQFSGFSITSMTIFNTITKIGVNAFAGCYSLKDVYYEGTEEDWKKLINKYNTIPMATIYYYSEEKPTESGNYWHYVYGEVTKWV